jgi:hypothetical protein
VRAGRGQPLQAVLDGDEVAERIPASERHGLGIVACLTRVRSLGPVC